MEPAWWAAVRVAMSILAQDFSSPLDARAWRALGVCRVLHLEQFDVENICRAVDGLGVGIRNTTAVFMGSGAHVPLEDPNVQRAAVEALWTVSLHPERVVAIACDAIPTQLRLLTEVAPLSDRAELVCRPGGGGKAERWRMAPSDILVGNVATVVLAMAKGSPLRWVDGAVATLAAERALTLVNPLLEGSPS